MGIPLRLKTEGENMKRNLIILNPCSGKKRANRYLTDIVDLFTKEGTCSYCIDYIRPGGRELLDAGLNMRGTSICKRV